MSPIERILSHSFQDKSLLAAALTHSSLREQRRTSYERLEFLGDRVLGLIVANLLLRRFPKEPEGSLAKRQAALIKRDTLAAVARKIGLAPHLKLSRGEEKTGGRDNPNLLSDTLEALLAALYLDGGLSAARGFAEPLWTPLIEEAKEPPKDAKTALQERTQALRLGLPVYALQDRQGPDHSPIFVVSVTVAGHGPTLGQGNSKRMAEQQAAASLLEALS